jgi:hypothetical protein
LTKQAADRLLYKGEEYELLGDTSRQLPLLQTYGVEPGAYGTGCYKGYVANYALVENGLFLIRLMIADVNNHYPEIGGVEPKFDQFFPATYDDLKVAMHVDSLITIGTDKPDNWLHADIRYPHDYACVLRLELRGGIAQQVEDISAQAASIRREMQVIFADADQNRNGYVPVTHSEANSERLRQLFETSRALMYDISNSSQ